MEKKEVTSLEEELRIQIGLPIMDVADIDAIEERIMTKDLVEKNYTQMFVSRDQHS